jgi:hypothetical protein
MPIELRFQLAPLRFHLFGIHAGQNLSGLHEHAFVGKNFLDAARRAGGDVYLHSLYAPVARDNAVRQAGTIVEPPEIVASRNHCGDHYGHNPVLGRFHDAVTSAFAAAMSPHSKEGANGETRAGPDRIYFT